MVRVVLLGRVSTDVTRKDPKTGKLVREPQDPENQLLPLRDSARRLGWDVVHEVPLRGLSGWDETEGAEVQRLVLDAVKEHRADVLMVWSLDRVTRGGAVSVLLFLKRLEKDLGIGFWSLQEPFLNTTSDPQQRELLLLLLSWVAKWESQRKSERLKAKAATKRHRAENGGGRARWGRGRMPTDEDLAEMTSLRASGTSLRAIAAKLGIPLATVHRHVVGT